MGAWVGLWCVCVYVCVCVCGGGVLRYLSWKYKKNLCANFNANLGAFFDMKLWFMGRRLNTYFSKLSNYPEYSHHPHSGGKHWYVHKTFLLWLMCGFRREKVILVTLGVPKGPGHILFHLYISFLQGEHSLTANVLMILWFIWQLTAKMIAKLSSRTSTN